MDRRDCAADSGSAASHNCGRGGSTRAGASRSRSGAMLRFAIVAPIPRSSPPRPGPARSDRGHSLAGLPSPQQASGTPAARPRRSHPHHSKHHAPSGHRCARRLHARAWRPVVRWPRHIRRTVRAAFPAIRRDPANPVWRRPRSASGVRAIRRIVRGCNSGRSTGSRASRPPGARCLPRPPAQLEPIGP